MPTQVVRHSNSAAAPIIVPTVTATALRTIHQQMSEQHALSAMQRTETSGLRLAQLAQAYLSEEDAEDFEDSPIAILAGLGETGAVGLVAARHLEAWGAWVQVVTTHPVEAYQAAAADKETASAMTALLDEGVATAWAEDGWELPPADLIIDAMMPSLDLKSQSHDLIQLVNSHHAPAISVGIPSGLNPDTGERIGPHLSAISTLSLGCPLSALNADGIGAICGNLLLADIDIPAEIYAPLGVDKQTLFGGEAIISLHHEHSKS